MASRDSSSPEVLNLEKLMRDYINNTNSNAEIELRNRIIKGDNLVDALDNIGFETEEETIKNKQLKFYYEEQIKSYSKLEYKYKELEEYHTKLLDTLELFVKNPFIKNIEEMIKLVEKAKALTKE